MMEPNSVQSLATINSVKVFFTILKCGLPVEPATLHVIIDNLLAHLANVLIYKQHLF